MFLPAEAVKFCQHPIVPQAVVRLWNGIEYPRSSGQVPNRHHRGQGNEATEQSER
jgi:hypothetical protein